MTKVDLYIVQKEIKGLWCVVAGCFTLEKAMTHYLRRERGVKCRILHKGQLLLQANVDTVPPKDTCWCVFSLEALRLYYDGITPREVLRANDTDYTWITSVKTVELGSCVTDVVVVELPQLPNNLDMPGSLLVRSNPVRIDGSIEPLVVEATLFIQNQKNRAKAVKEASRKDEVVVVAVNAITAKDGLVRLAGIGIDKSLYIAYCGKRWYMYTADANQLLNYHTNLAAAGRTDYDEWLRVLPSLNPEHPTYLLVRKIRDVLKIDGQLTGEDSVEKVTGRPKTPYAGVLTGTFALSFVNGWLPESTIEYSVIDKFSEEVQAFQTVLPLLIGTIKFSVTHEHNKSTFQYSIGNRDFVLRFLLRK